MVSGKNPDLMIWAWMDFPYGRDFVLVELLIAEMMEERVSVEIVIARRRSIPSESSSDPLLE